MLENMNVPFDIISDMKHDWCKVFPVDTSKFGSWVSENWISLGRIMKWIYSTIESVAPDFTFIFPPLLLKHGLINRMKVGLGTMAYLHKVIN